MKLTVIFKTQIVAGKVLLVKRRMNARSEASVRQEVRNRGLGYAEVEKRNSLTPKMSVATQNTSRTLKLRYLAWLA